ncbi:MAG: hypothetical protein ABI459_08230 [Deltaproteobacteria bacterium]
MLKAILIAVPVLCLPIVATAQDVMSSLSGTWAERGADCGDAGNQWVVLPGTLITPFDQCSFTVENAGGTSATVAAKCLPRAGGDSYQTDLTFEASGADAMSIAGQQLFKELARCAG